MRRDAVRLVVVARRVTCPYNYNDGNGGRNLADCYLNSITPNHPKCIDPEGTQAHRCPQVELWMKDLGLRTYRITPERTTINLRGEPHEEFPLQVLYMPLDREGRSWYALNAFTGQREEVVIRPFEYRDGKPICSSPLRVTPDGDSIEQQFTMIDRKEMDRRIALGGMLNIPYKQHIWRGVPSRDAWKCTCGSCTNRIPEERRPTMPDDNDDDFDPMAAQRRPHQAGTSKPAPSAGVIKFGDPNCIECRNDRSGFYACKEHRVKPLNWRPDKPVATPSKYFGTVTEEERQRAVAKIRAKQGLSSVPLTTTRSTRPATPPPPKPPTGPMTTAQAMTSTFKKKTTPTPTTKK